MINANLLYKELLDGELKNFDKTKHYIEIRCSNESCNVVNYSEGISPAVISFRLRPNSGCRKCQSKMNIKILTRK